jgi:hypothetical protein
MKEINQEDVKKRVTIPEWFFGLGFWFSFSDSPLKDPCSILGFDLLLLRIGLGFLRCDHFVIIFFFLFLYAE